MGVRFATFDDIPHMLKLAKRFHEMSQYSHYRFSPGGTTAYLRMLIANPTSVVIVADDYSGAIGATIQMVPFCEAKMVKEEFWYSEGATGIRLLNAYQAWVDEQNVEADVIGLLALSPSYDKASKLLSIKGYVASEVHHIREAK